MNPLDVIPPVVGIPMDGPRAIPTSMVAGASYEPAPRTHLGPSDWTYPMQVAAAAWLLASALVGVITVLQAEDAIRLAVYPAHAVSRLQMTATEALNLTNLVFTVLVAAAVVLAAVKVVIAISAYRRTDRWTYFAVIGLGALDALLSLVSLAALAADLVGGRPAAGDVLLLVVRLAGAGLGGWAVVALRRFGRPWALEVLPEETPVAVT